MAVHQIFNGFNTLIGLGLTICAFLMQSQIDRVCGSVPLRNSILGILVIGMTMFWLGGASLYNGSDLLTKNMFAGFVGALGATLVGLGSVIVQNSKKECKDDVVCKQTTKDKNSTPCDGARLWGGIVVGAGCLMIVGAGIHAMVATGTDQMAFDKLRDIKSNMDVARSTKAAKAERATQAAQKQKAQEMAATGVRPTNAQLLGGRGNLKKVGSV